VSADLKRTAIPTRVVLKGGKAVQRFTGVQQAETLVQALEAAALR
jgi:thioredoxin-like negative regulator of GroEL